MSLIRKIFAYDVLPTSIFLTDSNVILTNSVHYSHLDIDIGILMVMYYLESNFLNSDMAVIVNKHPMKHYNKHQLQLLDSRIDSLSK